MTVNSPRPATGSRLIAFDRIEGAFGALVLPELQPEFQDVSETP
jgi:hypothetical protein